ncbi:MAG: glycosyltransferase [Prevotella sp.]|nr:glycosyltransferase [Prevotella sp.]
MKITLISLSTPTFNNVRAASALPYHLIKGMQQQGNVSFDIYSFNINNLDTQEINKTEKELSVNIHLLPIPQWIKWMFKLHLLFLRILLRYPLFAYLKLSKEVVNQINKTDPDIVWLYGEELAGMSKKFPAHKCIVTMPDCESMYYYRMLRMPFATSELLKTLKYAFAYWQYKTMEHNSFQKSVVYHFVGKEDADFFRNINPKANAIFLPHPLYHYDNSKVIKFHTPKIKLLFAGRYDLYSQHGSDELLHAFMNHANELSDKFEITFLGKGWENWNLQLQTKGFSSQHINFVSDYVKELQKHDIQINAIDVGTGTKGKVLDALANGLMVIGTKYALENISVENMKSCIIYENSQQLISILKEIPNQKEKYEAIAEKGRNQVLTIHSCPKVAKQIFNLFD